LNSKTIFFLNKNKIVEVIDGWSFGWNIQSPSNQWQNGTSKFHHKLKWILKAKIDLDIPNGRNDGWS